MNLKELNETPHEMSSRKLVDQQSIRERRLSAKEFLKIKKISDTIYNYIKDSDIEVAEEDLKRRMNSTGKRPSLIRMQK